MANIKTARYELRDYNDAELLDSGLFIYDYGCQVSRADHVGVGMIFELCDKSSIEEYLGCMLVEHINNIGSDDRSIYFHDDPDGAGGIYPYEYTPQFCIADSGAESLAALKPYLFLRITLVTVIEDDED